jgi:hypothetical protein
MAEARPIALPFYHYGMHQVLPVGAKFPARGKTVRVLFGEPFDCETAKELTPPTLTALAYESLSELEQDVHPAYKLARV